MKKSKLLSLFVAGSLLFTAACNNTNESTSTSAENTNEQTSANTESDSTEGATDNTEGETDNTEGGDTDVDPNLGYYEEVIPEETVTLQVYSQLANYSGEQIGWFGQIIEEKFNVKLNIIPDSEGTFATRMESGNLGDIVVWGNDGDQYKQAIEQGMLFDLEEDDILDDFGPYIKEHMSYALEKNRGISEEVTGEPTLYGYGFDVAFNPNDTQDPMYTWDTRWDLYKEIGYPEINNLDDVVTMLEEMQKVAPTDDNGNKTYGVSLFSDWDGSMAMFVKSTVSAYYGYDEFGIGFYNNETGEYISALEEDGPYLEMLKFYNTLYRKGLLDPDSETQGFDGMVQDYQNGTAFLNIFNFMGSASYNTESHAAEGKAMYPVIPSEARPIVYGQSVYGGNRIWSVGAKSEHPELSLAIINWLSTPEGRLTFEYGPKGIAWDYDEEGNTFLTDFGYKAKTDQANTQMSEGDPAYYGSYSDGAFQINNTTWALDAENPESNGDTYNYKHWKGFSDQSSSEIEADFREHTGFDSVIELARDHESSVAINSTYSESPRGGELETVWNQVIDTIKTNSWRAIYANDDAEFDAIVEEMLTKAYEYGMEQCEEFSRNEAANRSAAVEKTMEEFN